MLAQPALVVINLDNNFQNQMQQQQQQPHSHSHKTHIFFCHMHVVRLVHGHKFKCEAPIICAFVVIFFAIFNLVSNFISNRFGTISFVFFLPFSAFVPCMEKNFDLFAAKATDLRSILFSSRHYHGARTHMHTHTPCACIIFAFPIFISRIIWQTNEKKTFGIMQSMTVITKRGAQNKTKAKTDQSTHARTHSVYVRVKNSIPKIRLDFFSLWFDDDSFSNVLSECVWISSPHHRHHWVPPRDHKMLFNPNKMHR